MEYTLTSLAFIFSLSLSLFPTFCCAQNVSDDISALKSLAETAPEPTEIQPLPDSPAEPDFHHRLLLNPIPGLLGEIRFLAAVPEASTVRALFTLDGKLLALPLKRDRVTGEHVGVFPTPFKSLDYQFQIASAKASVVSATYRAQPKCASAPAEEERFEGENELLTNIRLLRSDAALLTSAIKQIELILGKQQ